MSYLDVKVLRNFTRKLAATSFNGIGTNNTLGDTSQYTQPFSTPNTPPPGAESFKFDDPRVSALQNHSRPAGIPEIDSPAASARTTGATLPSSPPQEFYPNPTDAAAEIEHARVPTSPTMAPPAGTENIPAGNNAVKQRGWEDWLLPVGLTGGLGLGAMGLANALRSKKDEEDEGSWTPYLAGLGGAAGGYALSQMPYVQQLASGLLGGKADATAQPPVA